MNSTAIYQFESLVGFRNIQELSYSTMYKRKLFDRHTAHTNRHIYFIIFGMAALAASPFQRC